MNLALYRTFMQPVVRAMCAARRWREAMHELHPLRLQYQLFVRRQSADGAGRPPWAKQVREHRAPAAEDNPFVAFQETMSQARSSPGSTPIATCATPLASGLFLTVYGSPVLQAAVGIDPADARRPRQAGTSPLHRQLVDTRIAELKAKMPQGGLREGLRARDSLCRHAARRRRRARVRGHPPHPGCEPRRKDAAPAGTDDADARRIQGAWCASSSSCC